MAHGVTTPKEVGSLRNYFVEPSGGGGETEFSVDGQTSLLDMSQDRVYTYHHSRNVICVGGVKQLVALTPADQLPVQEEIALTITPWFKVNQLCLHPATEDVCMLWGHRGAAVVCWERRGSEATLLVKFEALIAEKVYREHPNLSISQCRWLPIDGSRLLLILNSDSFLRVYNAESGDVLGCFNLGPVDSFPLMTKFSPEINPETPIDFDFGPYIRASKSWMIFALKPTGTVFCALLGVVGANIRCFLNSYREIKAIGSENIGTEENFACLLCSKQFPVVLVIGQSDGRVTHSVMLPVNANTDGDEEDMENKLVNSYFILVTKERLSLPMSDECSNSSVHLRLDPLFDERYIWIHGSGVHLVTMKFLPEIIRFLENDEEASLSSLSPSVISPLVVWKVGDCPQPVNKIVGIPFSSNQPQKLLCVLQDNRTILYSLPHPSDVHSRDRKSDSSSSSSSPTKSVLGKAKSFLNTPKDQPFYCSDQNVGDKEMHKLLMTTIKAKLEQLEGMERAIQYLSGYVNSLDQKSKGMKKSVTNLFVERVGLKDKAERVAEIYEDRAEYNVSVQKRHESVLYRFHQMYPILTDKEKAWQQTLHKINDDVKSMKLFVDRLNDMATELKDNDFGHKVKLKQNQLQEIREEITNQQVFITNITTNLRQIHDHLIRR